MAMGGVPGWGDVRPPQSGAVAEASVHNPIYVESWGDPEISGVDDPIPDT